MIPNKKMKFKSITHITPKEIPLRLFNVLINVGGNGKEGKEISWKTWEVALTWYESTPSEK